MANRNSDSVSVIDETTNTVNATMPVGKAPDGVAVDPINDTVYAADRTSNAVSVITTGRAAQAITFGSAAPSGPAFGDTYAVGASASSGLPVVFSVDATTDNYGTAGVACTVSGATVTFTHAGSCVIDADQPGDANYTAAPTVQQTVAVAQTGQQLTFTAPTPVAGSTTVSGTVGGGAVVSAAGGGSGAPVSLSVDAASSAVCTLSGAVSGSTVTYIGAGTCTIDAAQAGDADYAAGSASLDINVGQAGQAITFGSAAPSGPAFGDTYAVGASASWVFRWSSVSMRRPTTTAPRAWPARSPGRR